MPAEQADADIAAAAAGGFGWAVVAVTAAGLMVLFHFLGPDWKIAFLAAEVVLISVVIAQACDPFADAAQHIGEAANIPGSVRGATLDAVASSMPELFCGIFFVVLTMAATGAERPADPSAAAEGYGATIATCAGSAVYNMILIPAFCAIFISFSRRHRPTVIVDDEVISRDGVWFVCCEILMILFLFQDQMYWWMGVIFLLLYVLYVCQLYRDAISWRRKMAAVAEVFKVQGNAIEVGTATETIRESGVRVSYNFVAQAIGKLKLRDDSEADVEDEDTAGVFFGRFQVPLNTASAWCIIAVSTIVAAVACYFLVEATRQISTALAIPMFFVAVIVAAAASSVPDTLLAIGAAKRGDDSGAVSNAFGSNIFDICVCLSIPLLVNSWLTGWSPVSLLQDGKPLPGLVGLRILLVILTIVTLAIMWHNRELTRKKAFVLCGLYLVFIAYAVMGSLGVGIG